MTRNQQRNSRFYSARLCLEGARHAQHRREHEVVEHGQPFQEAGRLPPRVPRLQDVRSLAVTTINGKGGGGSWLRVIVVSRGAGRTTKVDPICSWLKQDGYYPNTSYILKQGKQEKNKDVLHFVLQKSHSTGPFFILSNVSRCVASFFLLAVLFLSRSDNLKHYVLASINYVQTAIIVCTYHIYGKKNPPREPVQGYSRLPYVRNSDFFLVGNINVSGWSMLKLIMLHIVWWQG